MKIDARTGYTPSQHRNVQAFKASDTQKVSSFFNVVTGIAILATILVMSGFIR